MPRKTKIILISVFILVGAILLGLYFYNKNKDTPTTGESPSFYQKFNPFGTSNKIIPNENNPDEEGEGNQTGGENIVNSRFTKLTDFAISGATFFEDTRTVPSLEPGVEPITEIVPSLRYVERATGHVYQTYLDTKITGKISNSTIPSVYEIIFDSRANSVIYRYISEDDKSITSFLATLGGKSNFLNTNILAISLSPDKSKFFSIIKSASGVIGTTKSFDETKTSQVFTSAFSEWTPQWATEQSIYLTTKPSYLVEGSIFSLNIANGTLSKIFGGVSGLTTLASNDGANILYGATLNSGPRLNIFNIKNRTSVDLDKYGLPEKCVWSLDNVNIYCAVPNTIVGIQYPDSWYQGLVSFDDYFIKINTLTKETSTLANSKNETPIDGTQLFLNKDESKLFFINKKDGTLWSLDL